MPSESTRLENWSIKSKNSQPTRQNKSELQDDTEIRNAAQSTLSFQVARLQPVKDPRCQRHKSNCKSERQGHHEQAVTNQSPLNHKKSSKEPLPPNLALMSSRWPRFTEQFPSFGSASRSLPLPDGGGPANDDEGAAFRGAAFGGVIGAADRTFEGVIRAADGRALGRILGWAWRSGGRRSGFWPVTLTLVCNFALGATCWTSGTDKLRGFWPSSSQAPIAGTGFSWSEPSLPDGTQYLLLYKGLAVPSEWSTEISEGDLPVSCTWCAM